MAVSKDIFFNFSVWLAQHKQRIRPHWPFHLHIIIILI